MEGGLTGYAGLNSAGRATLLQVERERAIDLIERIPSMNKVDDAKAAEGARQVRNKPKVNLRKVVVNELKQVFDVEEDQTLPAEHVNESLMFLISELKKNTDMKARFWTHMADAKRKRAEATAQPGAKRQRRYRERVKLRKLADSDKDLKGGEIPDAHPV